MELWEYANRFALSKQNEILGPPKAKFAYYTSAETVLKILRNKEVWMRNAALMNDFQEIRYGADRVVEAFGRNSRFQNDVASKLEVSHPGFLEKFIARADGWLHDLQNQTYITCVSRHLEAEDNFGRLSMWRAYGSNKGVAMVFSSEPFLREDDFLKVYSVPVQYFTLDQARHHLEDLIAFIEAEPSITSMDVDDLVHQLAWSLEIFCLSTKHPGFSEEQEWRVFYRPNFEPSDYVEADVECINGVPQRVMKLKLSDAAGIQIKDILERVIIGPVDYGVSIADALASELEKLGIKNPYDMISLSGIPLRE